MLKAICIASANGGTVASNANDASAKKSVFAVAATGQNSQSANLKKSVFAIAAEKQTGGAFDSKSTLSWIF